MPEPHLLATSRGPVELVDTGAGPAVPAVLALHGAMGGYDQSLLLARAALPFEAVRVLAVSRPPYLATPLSSGPTPETQADLYAALLDALGLDHAVVLAISGGGPSALQFALRHPHRCRALILISACTAPLTAPLPLRFHLLRLAARWPWLLHRMAAGPSLDARLQRSVRDPQSRDRLRQDAPTLALFEQLQTITLQRLSNRMDGTFNDLRSVRTPFHYPVERLHLPVLLAHGTSDIVVPIAHSERLAASVPSAELLRLEGGEHNALFTHNREIRAAVEAFLARLP